MTSIRTRTAPLLLVALSLSPLPAVEADAAEEMRRRSKDAARRDGVPSSFSWNQDEILGLAPAALSAGDLNRDGLKDIIVAYASHDESILTVLSGQPSPRRGTFPPVPFATLPAPVDWVGIGDLDADGAPDILTSSRLATSLYWLAAADGFREVRRMELDGSPTALLLADMGRKDGLPDLAVAIRSNGHATVAVQMSPIVSSPWIRRSIESPARRLSITDENRDQIPDLRVEFERSFAAFAVTETAIEPLGSGEVTRPSDIALSQSPRGALSLETRLGGTAMAETVTATSRGIRIETFAAATTFTVDSTGDTSDSTPGDGICDTGTGECTLRAAIMEANASPGNDAIEFSIGSGPRTISPLSPLPVVTESLLLDGTTQPGYGSEPVIELSGLSAGVATTGLTIQGSFVTIQALRITGFDGDGIDITGDDNVVRLCDAGTDGALAKPNGAIGVFIDHGSRNLIGGPGGGNLISGNGTDGIDVAGGTGNRIEGNFVGTDRTGVSAIPNTFFGIFVDAIDTDIGGTAAGAGNLVSGNGEAGIIIRNQSDGAKLNRIQGNIVGLDVSGQAAMGNVAEGILVRESDQNTIGGPAPSARNVVSSNQAGGIFIRGKNGAGAANTISGNYIGTTADGLLGRGNMFDGIFLRDAGNATIGGSLPQEGNIIADNTASGIVLLGVDSTGTVIRGNCIGTAADCLAPLGNTESGVVFEGAPTNQVLENVLSSNGGAGVLVSGGAIGNQVSKNSIHGNGTLAIDLAPAPPGDGVSPNDPLDADSGANDLQNFPLISQASLCNDQLEITGTLSSTPSQSFTVEFFSSPTCDLSGHGEAATYLGSASVSADASGMGTFTAALPEIPEGRQVTATATDAAGNTSELSACKQVVDNRPQEASNLTFLTKESLAFTAAAGATSHRLLRGSPADLPALLDGTIDSCTRFNGTATTITGLTENPSPGSFYWFLVVGDNGCGAGPSGNNRTVDSSGSCP